MSSYSEQISRIKEKLPMARRADQQLNVFGASSHQYRIGPPATEAEVLAFEQEYQLRLPECYREFLLNVGNGNGIAAHPAAGPFYGIYPLGEKVNDLIVEHTADYLKELCPLRPDMTAEEWEILISGITAHDEQVSTDEDYERAYGKVYAGLLPITSQGCTYINGLVLNGPYRGRVLNLDYDLQLPGFTYEAHFLDWYERWLDEIISGELTEKDSPTWFGYVKGGAVPSLLEDVMDHDDAQKRSDALAGLLNKNALDKKTLNGLASLAATDETARIQIIEILCKFDYALAKPYLEDLLTCDLSAALKCIHNYAPGKSGFWVSAIEEHMDQVKDRETLRYVYCILKAAHANYGKLLAPFTQSTDSGMREMAFYALGTCASKADFLELFIAGLNDPSDGVVRCVLQAACDLKDKRLLPPLKTFALRFTGELQGYDGLLSNLNNLLWEYGLNHKMLLEQDEPPAEEKSLTRSGNGMVTERKKKWYAFWK